MESAPTPPGMSHPQPFICSPLDVLPPWSYPSSVYFLYHLPCPLLPLLAHIHIRRGFLPLYRDTHRCQHKRKAYQRLSLKTPPKCPVSTLGLWLNFDNPSRAWFQQLNLPRVYTILIFYSHIPSLALPRLPCQLLSTISASPHSPPAAILGSLPLLGYARQSPILQLNSQFSPLLQAPSLTSLEVTP